MKLKLEAQDEVTFLGITDYITPQHIPVLKAGLNRLIAEKGRKTIILDFSALPESAFQPATVMQEISALQLWASQAGAQLLTISTVQGWGDGNSRQAVLDLLKSPLAKLRATESQLKTGIGAFEKTRAELEKKIAATGISEDELKSLRRENGRLKSRIAETEAQIRLRLSSRTEPCETSTNRAKLETATKILVSVLEKEGALPIA